MSVSNGKWWQDVPRSRLFWIGPLILVMLLLHGTKVPYDNEPTYLLDLYKLWHPEVLANDFQFGGLRREHLVFKVLVGPLTLFLPLVAVAWIGRVGAWVALSVAFLRLGEHFRIPRWMTAGAVILWLAGGQSIVGGEWIIGGFEAKVVAYPLLLFSIDAFLQRKDRRGGILLGLCFSFHAAVGLSGAFAVLLALLVERRTLGGITPAVGWFMLFALPGVLTTATLAFDSVRGGRDTWQFVVMSALPFHMDPFTFSRRAWLVLVLMAGFVAWHALSRRDDAAIRFTGLFLGGLALVTVGGVVVRLVGWFELLQVFPFRLLPLFAPLLFFLHLAHAFHHSGVHRVGWPGTVSAVLALVLYNPVPIVQRDLERRVRSWQPDPMRDAFTWIRDNSSQDAVVISHPYRRDSYYWTRRAQIATLLVVDHRDILEWRARVEALLGGSVPLEPMVFYEVDRRYGALTTEQIEDIVARFGGDFFVTSGEYPYPEVFAAGDVKVYRLSSAGSADEAAGAVRNEG